MEVLDSASGVIVEADTPPASGRPSPGGGAEDTAVRVAVRVRPFVPKERLEQCRPCVRTLCEEGQIIIGKDRAFAFDYVFGEESSQEQVFEAACAPLVQRCFQGYNATVFAYGQARPSTRTHPKSHSSLLNRFRRLSAHSEDEAQRRRSAKKKKRGKPLRKISNTQRIKHPFKWLIPWTG